MTVIVVTEYIPRKSKEFEFYSSIFIIKKVSEQKDKMNKIIKLHYTGEEYPTPTPLCMTLTSIFIDLSLGRERFKCFAASRSLRISRIMITALIKERTVPKTANA